MLINIGEIIDKYSDGSKNTINGVSKRRYTFMSNISGIGSTSAVLNSDSKSTTTSSGSEWNDKFHKILTGNSDNSSASSSNSDGSKTTIERSVSRGTDGSMIVTLTQVTTAANGSRTSKVISKTKMGGSIDDNTNGKSNNGDPVINTQLQGILGQNVTTSNYAGNEYDRNSDIGVYVSGVALKKEC